MRLGQAALAQACRITIDGTLANAWNLISRVHTAIRVAMCSIDDVARQLVQVVDNVERPSVIGRQCGNEDRAVATCCSRQPREWTRHWRVYLPACIECIDPVGNMVIFVGLESIWITCAPFSSTMYVVVLPNTTTT